MAEAVFRHHAVQHGIADQLEIDSAGTGHWHVGNLPHNGTLSVLASNGILTNHRARQIHPRDLNHYDYIIVMDRDNKRDVELLGVGAADVRLMMEFGPDSGPDEVPDPYYTGEFGLVFELVEAASLGLITEIKQRLA